MTEHKHHWKLWNTTKQIFNKELGHVEFKNEYKCECGEVKYRDPTKKQLGNIGQVK